MRRMTAILTLVLSMTVTGNAFTPGDDVVLQWAKELAPLASSGIDVPAAITTDSHGSIYVTGKSEGQSTDYDYLTLKYSSAGIELWRIRYDGSYHGADIPMAIAVDNLMNVYVTGMSASSDSSAMDIVTVKYSSDGIQQWVAQHAGVNTTGSGNGTDVPYDIAVDASNNLYVTGFHSVDDLRDFVTLKYNSSGVQEWASTYDGRAGSNDEARSIEVDPSGNVYVTGMSTDSVDEVYSDELGPATTIKYSPEGEIIWISEYSPDDSSLITPVDMQIGTDGTLYIAANLRTAGYQAEDVVTLNLSDEGVLLWARRYTASPFSESSGDVVDRATGLALDGAGNVYVTGGSGSVQPYPEFSDSIFTVKYTPDGAKLWHATHGRELNEVVQSAGIAVDGNGNTYVAGTHGHLSPGWFFVADSTVLIRYTSLGVPVWADYFGASDDTIRFAKGIALGEQGGPLLISEVGRPDETDIVLSHFSMDGTRMWTATAAGPGNTTAFVNDAFVDEEGTIYVTGGVARPGNTVDYLTMKVSPSGDMVWSATYTGTSGGESHARTIAVDNEKSVFVMGNVLIGQSPYRWGTAVIKYNSDGTELWRTEVDSTYSYSLALGRNGTLFFGGTDLFKLHPDGSVEWRIDNDPYYFDNLAVDGSGNIYSATWEYLSKFDDDGNELWANSFSGGLALAIDDSDFIFVSRYAYSNGSTSKFTPAGEEKWTLPYGGSQMRISGDILYASGMGSVYALTRQGEHLWSQTHPVTWFEGNDIAVGKFGVAFSIYTGWDFAESMNLEMVTTRYSLSGNQTWSGAFDGSWGQSYREIAIGTDSLGNIFAIGEHWTANFGTVPFIVKYGPSSPVTSASTSEDERPMQFALFQNYPNPFNPTTEIRFQISEAGDVTLQIYDILGREITTVVNEHLQPGSYRKTVDGSQFSSGVYFYRLISGSRVAVKSMLMLK